MFDFLWNLFKTDCENTRIVKNFLRTCILRRRYLQKRSAAISIQSMYRYHRLKNKIKKRLRDNGNVLLDEQFALKQNWLLKLRGELFTYIKHVDDRLSKL